MSRRLCIKSIWKSVKKYVDYLLLTLLNAVFNCFCYHSINSLFIREQSRDGTLQVPPKTSFHTRCIFTEGGVKCGERIIPCSKFCRKHILEDRKQVLFQACNIEKAGVICKEPVPSIFEDATCILHVQLPPQRNYAKKKYESDSDEGSTSTNSLTQIKKQNSSETETAQPQSENDSFEKDITMAEPKTEEKPAPQIIDKNVTISHDDTSEQKPDTNAPIKEDPLDQ